MALPHDPHSPRTEPGSAAAVLWEAKTQIIEEWNRQVRRQHHRAEVPGSRHNVSYGCSLGCPVAPEQAGRLASTRLAQRNTGTRATRSRLTAPWR